MTDSLYISSDGATSPNRANYEKPNEDYLIIDDVNMIYAVLDGVSRDKVSGRYPNPSPARIVTEVFAETVYESIVNAERGKQPRQVLLEAVINGNKQVKNYNSRQSWSFLPGTVGVISLIAYGCFWYVSVGDCSIRLFREGKIRLLTSSQTQLVRENRDDLSAEEIRNVIANNSNHPFAYGVFNGDERVVDLLEFGNMDIRIGDIFTLASDGLDVLFENGFQPEKCTLSAFDLIREAESMEIKNPHLHSDDKTIIRIVIN